MLVKYYGLAFDKEKNTWLPRSNFILNGLFRMTQPKYLNDKGSEARLWPYFNKFSPADYAWAKKSILNFSFLISILHLLNFWRGFT